MEINKYLQVLLLATFTVFSTGLGYTVSADMQEKSHMALTAEFGNAADAASAQTASNNACVAPTIGTCQAPCGNPQI